MGAIPKQLLYSQQHHLTSQVFHVVPPLVQTQHLDFFNIHASYFDEILSSESLAIFWKMVFVGASTVDPNCTWARSLSVEENACSNFVPWLGEK